MPISGFEADMPAQGKFGAEGLDNSEYRILKE